MTKTRQHNPTGSFRNQSSRPLPFVRSLQVFHRCPIVPVCFAFVAPSLDGFRLSQLKYTTPLQRSQKHFIKCFIRNLAACSDWNAGVLRAAGVSSRVSATIAALRGSNGASVGTCRQEKGPEPIPIPGLSLHIPRPTLRRIAARQGFRSWYCEVLFDDHGQHAKRLAVVEPVFSDVDVGDRVTRINRRLAEASHATRAQQNHQKPNHFAPLLGGRCWIGRDLLARSRRRREGQP